MNEAYPRGMKQLFALLLLLLVATLSFAKEAAPLAEDEAVEKRMVAISDEMRCLVCQNESLSGSRAELAQDLRREIRTMIKEGKTDQEIMDFMVNRYGDFVRYRPPMKATTYLLWFGPFLLLAIAVVALINYLRRRGARLEEGTGVLSAEEKQRAQALLNEGKR
jgi:cytochrome c-type biogenesis protein CcmH